MTKVRPKRDDARSRTELGIGLLSSALLQILSFLWRRFCFILIRASKQDSNVRWKRNRSSPLKAETFNENDHKKFQLLKDWIAFFSIERCIAVLFVGRGYRLMRNILFLKTLPSIGQVIEFYLLMIFSSNLSNDIFFKTG